MKGGRGRVKKEIRERVRVSKSMRYLTTASAVLCAPLERLYGEEASKKSNDLRGRLDELLNIRSNEEEAMKALCKVAVTRTEIFIGQTA